MHLRLHYANGELYTEAGVPLTQVAVATGLNDPNEAALPELLDGLIELGYTSIHITLAKPPRHGRKTRRAKHARRAVAKPVA
jgi:hypothetical protein